jgi:hypothetical protein
MSLFEGIGSSADPILQLADRSYRDHRDAAHALVAAKTALLRGYDPLHMDRAATICHWGRSGSVLLASFFDRHDDVIAMPNQTSEYAYPFFADYPSLSVWQKLIVYPAYSSIKKGNAGDFFLKNNPDGDFAIEAADYFASVEALFAIYADRPDGEIETRRAFFQLLHVAYAGALGKPAVNPRPLMLSAQHWLNDQLAQRFVEDFPDGRFLHTIRDPISAFDSWLERHFLWQFGDNADLSSKYRYPAFDAVRDLLSWDAGHRGMRDRTRAVRFEDMHLAPAQTLTRLAEWLGVPYRPSMLESTLNGNPYVVQAGGRTWVGPNPESARRRSKNLNALDRLLVSALLSRNFSEWRYPPSRFSRAPLPKACVILVGSLIPSRMELVGMRKMILLQTLPALRRGRLAFALRAALVLAVRRARMMHLIVIEALRRTIGTKRPMQII